MLETTDKTLNPVADIVARAMKGFRTVYWRMPRLIQRKVRGLEMSTLGKM